MLFNSLSGGNPSGLNKDVLKQMAADLGLNTETFNQCLDSGKYVELVKTQTSTAQQVGVRSTPAFLINGEVLIGAQGFEAFQEVIERQLSGGDR